MMKLVVVKNRNLPIWICCGCIDLTISLENNELPNKNDIIMMAWKPRLMINDTRAIVFSERYSGAVFFFITINLSDTKIYFYVR
jgi:hypothetical protein